MSQETLGGVSWRALPVLCSCFLLCASVTPQLLLLSSSVHAQHQRNRTEHHAQQQKSTDFVQEQTVTDGLFLSAKHGSNATTSYIASGVTAHAQSGVATVSTGTSNMNVNGIDPKGPYPSRTSRHHEIVVRLLEERRIKMSAQHAAFVHGDENYDFEAQHRSFDRHGPPNAYAQNLHLQPQTYITEEGRELPQAYEHPHPHQHPPAELNNKEEEADFEGAEGKDESATFQKPTLFKAEDLDDFGRGLGEIYGSTSGFDDGMGTGDPAVQNIEPLGTVFEGIVGGDTWSAVSNIQNDFAASKNGVTCHTSTTTTTTTPVDNKPTGTCRKPIPTGKLYSC